MKFLPYFLIASFFFPGVSFAMLETGKCSSDGYTVATINGVLTDKQGAIDNMVALKNNVGKVYQGQEIDYQYLLNPSHIGGIGDVLMAVYQKFFDSETVSDYDLVEMIKSASEKVQTQKLLLVGHSQGNFYTNSMYDTLADASGGVPAQSIGVYSVATPSGHVAGNGKWLTSDTDKVIADLVALFPFKKIKEPNTSIPVQFGVNWIGHDFADVYLKYRYDQIIPDIQSSLDTLKENSIQNMQKPCIAVPDQNIVHTIQGEVLTRSDFIMGKIWYVFSSPVAVAQTTGIYLGTSVASAVKDAGSSLLALLYNVPVPPASSLIAGALPLVPAQTVQPPTTPSVPSPTIATPAPQIATEVTIPSGQVLVSEATSTSPVEAMPVIATSTPTIVAAAPSVFQGGGSVTGVSAEDLAKQAQAAQEASLLAQNTAITTEQTATSTADITATSTADTTVTPKTEIAYDPNSVVINEIAWMGTKAQANDEWIELYNRTDAPVDLSGWTVESKNKSLSVALEGSVSPHGYFLLERTASTTTDQLENMTYNGALADSGSDANLYLKNGTTTIDFVDFGYWLFRDNNAKRTMERVSPYATSTLYYNWRTYSESLSAPFAKDAKGNDIFGTPGAKNSVNGFYTPTGDISEDTTWYAKYSPYYVPTTITVREGATLTIEPGVTVKFAKGAPYGGGMDVRGVLQAQGATDKPIIFTSFLDDASDGIDSNQDGAATLPAPADWMNINFYNKQEPSKIRYAHTHYGGQGINYNPNGWYPTYSGAVAMYGASPEISDTIFVNNHAIAVYAKDGAHPLLLRNTIRDTVVPTHAGAGPGGFGIKIADASSTADIIGNTFERNNIGIVSESATSVSLVVKDNLFTDNQRNGEFKGYANFNLENSGNRDTGRKGGFYINLLVSDGQHKTLKKDAMPYIMESGFTIAAGGVLVIEPGTVFKSRNPNIFMVRGTLNARGTEASPIVFTSIADDSDGYDSDNASAIPLPGTWENIQFLGASSSDSVFDYATISYGGRGHNTCPWASVLCMEYPGAVVIDNASPTISHSRFISNHAPDITVNGDSSPVFTDNAFL